MNIHGLSACMQKRSVPPLDVHFGLGLDDHAGFSMTPINDAKTATVNINNMIMQD
jgi:hypothetical protein